jgi:hypothetical protein
MPEAASFKPDNSKFKGLALASAQPDDTVFLPFALAPDMREELISYKNAKQLAQAIDLTQPGAAVYAFVDGTFIFGDFIEALIVAKNYHVKELLITALTIKEENVDSLRNLLDGEYVDRLGILISDYNFSQNRWTLMPYLVEMLGHEGRAQDGRLAFAAVRSHCKIALIETHCGKHLVLHGSANLVSSGNVEQFQLEDNAPKYAFNHAFLSGLLAKYNVLNRTKPDIRRQKALTKSQTWQQVPASTNTPTAFAKAVGAPAAKRASAVQNATPAPVAATTEKAISPPETSRSKRAKKGAIAGIKQQ